MTLVLSGMIPGRTDQEKHGWLLPMGNPKASGKDERNYCDYLYAKSHVTPRLTSLRLVLESRSNGNRLLKNCIRRESKLVLSSL